MWLVCHIVINHLNETNELTLFCTNQNKLCLHKKHYIPVDETFQKPHRYMIILLSYDDEFTVQTFCEQ